MDNSDKRTPPAAFTRAVYDDTVKWWGIRLLLYNGIMLVTGLTMLLIANTYTPVSPDAFYYFSPENYIVMAIYYALLANGCFIAGAAVLLLTVKRFPELIARKEAYYRFFFRWGITVSVGMNLLIALLNAYIRLSYKPTFFPE